MPRVGALLLPLLGGATAAWEMPTSATQVGPHSVAAQQQQQPFLFEVASDVSEALASLDVRDRRKLLGALACIHGSEDPLLHAACASEEDALSMRPLALEADRHGQRRWLASASSSGSASGSGSGVAGGCPYKHESHGATNRVRGRVPFPSPALASACRRRATCSTHTRKAEG